MLLWVCLAGLPARVEECRSGEKGCKGGRGCAMELKCA